MRFVGNLTEKGSFLVADVALRRVSSSGVMDLPVAGQTKVPEMGRRPRYASQIDPLRPQAQCMNYKAELLTLGTVKNMLHTRSSHPGDRRGFTLIELIVAIVVLGLLATLALMGFRATIDRSTDAKQMTHTQSLLREARTLYVQKI